MRSSLALIARLMFCAFVVVAVGLAAVPQASAHPNHDGLDQNLVIEPDPIATSEPDNPVDDGEADPIERTPFTDASPDLASPLDPVDIAPGTIAAPEQALADPPSASTDAAAVPEIESSDSTAEAVAEPPASAPEPPAEAAADPAPSAASPDSDVPVLAFTGAAHQQPLAAVAFGLVGCGCLLAATDRRSRRDR